MLRNRILLSIAASIVVLSFFLFTTAPTHAATEHNSKVAAPLCGWVQNNSTNSPSGTFTLILWRYTCDGGVHAQLVAHTHGTYYVDLYEYNGSYIFLDSNQQTLSPGQGMNTGTFHYADNGYIACGLDNDTGDNTCIYYRH